SRIGLLLSRNDRLRAIQNSQASTRQATPKAEAQPARVASLPSLLRYLAASTKNPIPIRTKGRQPKHRGPYLSRQLCHSLSFSFLSRTASSKSNRLPYQLAVAQSQIAIIAMSQWYRSFVLRVAAPSIKRRRISGA